MWRRCSRPRGWWVGAPAVTVGWRGSDLPAHLLRMQLIERDGFEVWNNRTAATTRRPTAFLTFVGIWTAVPRYFSVLSPLSPPPPTGISFAGTLTKSHRAHSCSHTSLSPPPPLPLPRPRSIRRLRPLHLPRRHLHASSSPPPPLCVHLSRARSVPGTFRYHTGGTDVAARTPRVNISLDSRPVSPLPPAVVHSVLTGDRRHDAATTRRQRGVCALRRFLTPSSPTGVTPWEGSPRSSRWDALDRPRCDRGQIPSGVRSPTRLGGVSNWCAPSL